MFVHISVITLMKKLNDNRTQVLQELKNVTRSGFSITEKAESRLYHVKMRKIKASGNNTTRRGDKSEASSIIPISNVSKNNIKSGNTSISLKQQYDKQINDIFLEIDFDRSGFITSAKISHYKKLPETTFYFLGGVFQKIRQVGSATKKMFISLCDEAFAQAKAEDLQGLIYPKSKQEVVQKQNQNNAKKPEKAQACYHYSKKSQSARKSYEKRNMTSTMSNSNVKSRTKDSINYQGEPQKSRNKRLLWRDRSLDNFQSLRLKQLSERLDRQIEYSQARINLMRLWKD